MWRVAASITPSEFGASVRSRCTRRGSAARRPPQPPPAPGRRPPVGAGRHGASSPGAAAMRARREPVLVQDRALERLELGARLEPKLVREERARRAVNLQRFGLPAGAVEREHQLPMRSLRQRVLGDELLELPDHRCARPHSSRASIGRPRRRRAAPRVGAIPAARSRRNGSRRAQGHATAPAPQTTTARHAPRRRRPAHDVPRLRDARTGRRRARRRRRSASNPRESSSGGRRRRSCGGARRRPATS